MIIEIWWYYSSIPLLKSCWKKQHSHTPFMFFRDWLKKICEANNTKTIALSLIAKQSFFARVLGWLHTRNWWHMMAHDHHDHSKNSPADSNLTTPPKGVTCFTCKIHGFPFFSDFPGLIFQGLIYFSDKTCENFRGWYVGGSSQAVVSHPPPLKPPGLPHAHRPKPRTTF